jgi:hypothetical protein
MYSCVANPICRRLLRQEIRCADPFARPSEGNNIAAKIAMIAITTSNSIKVNARITPGNLRLLFIFITF